jgi:hypothetical protein
VPKLIIATFTRNPRENTKLKIKRNEKLERKIKKQPKSYAQKKKDEIGRNQGEHPQKRESSDLPLPVHRGMLHDPSFADGECAPTLWHGLKTVSGKQETGRGALRRGTVFRVRVFVAGGGPDHTSPSCVCMWGGISSSKHVVERVEAVPGASREAHNLRTHTQGEGTEQGACES